MRRLNQVPPGQYFGAPVPHNVRGDATKARRPARHQRKEIPPFAPTRTDLSVETRSWRPARHPRRKFLPTLRLVQTKPEAILRSPGTAMCHFGLKPSKSCPRKSETKRRQ